MVLPCAYSIIVKGYSAQLFMYPICNNDYLEERLAGQTKTLDVLKEVLAVKGRYSGDAGRARELMKRMLRRVK